MTSKGRRTQDRVETKSFIRYDLDIYKRAST